MENTSASRLAELILANEPEPEDLVEQVIAEALASDEGSSALFRDLVEPLADNFEFRLVNSYTHIFARVIEAATFCCVVAVVSSRLRRSTSA